MFDLNDDCLLEVLQYLTIQETFLLLDTLGKPIKETAHRRIAQLKYLNFSLRNPPELTSGQLQIIGKYLKTLKITVGYSLSSEVCISQYLEPLCFHGSIQNVTLNYVRFDESYLKCILKLASSLRFLDLNFCQLTDELLQPIVENCLQLETLVILGNYEWKGKSLHCIKSPAIRTISVELNELCNDEVNAFKAVRGEHISLHVYDKGRNICQTFANKQ